MVAREQVFTPSLLHLHFFTLTPSPSLLHPHFFTLTSSPSLLPPYTLRPLFQEQWNYCLCFEHKLSINGDLFIAMETCHDIVFASTSIPGETWERPTPTLQSAVLAPTEVKIGLVVPWSCVSSQVVLWYDLGCNYWDASQIIDIKKQLDWLHSSWLLNIVD